MTFFIYFVVLTCCQHIVYRSVCVYLLKFCKLLQIYFYLINMLEIFQLNSAVIWAFCIVLYVNLRSNNVFLNMNKNKNLMLNFYYNSRFFISQYRILDKLQKQLFFEIIGIRLLHITFLDQFINACNNVFSCFRVYSTSSEFF